LRPLWLGGSNLEVNGAIGCIFGVKKEAVKIVELGHYIDCNIDSIAAD
jgi:hypothetical protein